MRFYYSYFAVFTLMLLSVSCSHPKAWQHENDIWVGSHQIADRTIPYPWIITRNGANCYLINHLGYRMDSCIVTTFDKGDTLRMINHPFEVIYKDETKLNIFQLNDTINFPFVKGNKNWKYRAQLVKALKSDKLYKDEIAKTLNGNTFVATVSDENPNDQLIVQKYLTFDGDSLQTRYDYLYNDKLMYAEYQSQPCHLSQVNNCIFLSCHSDEDNPQPIMQILEANKSKLTIRGFINGKETIDTFSSIEKPKSVAILYSNCYDGHIGEYYHNRTDVTFDQGNDFLIKMIGQDAPLDQGDGYIIIHFNINCKSQCGRPGVITMDKSYQSRTFSVAMINHILSHVMKLKDWPTSVSDQDYFVYKDVHAFLMFKIENGKITDLCP